MDKNLLDIGVATGLFLFTGVETVGIESTVLEIISKFGVVAVLWFWLKSMKKQMHEQMKVFNEETTKLRTEHKETLKEFSDVHKEHKEMMAEQLKAKDEIIKSLKK